MQSQPYINPAKGGSSNIIVASFSHKTMIFSRFLGHMGLMNIIFVVFCVVVLMESHQANGKGKEELTMMAELSSREEAVKWAGYGEDRLSTVVIGGKLLCHVASSHHKFSSHPYPVSGAGVAVFCGTCGRTKKSWAKGSTDSYGVFLIDLPSHLHAIPNLEKICHVKVLHLPKSSPCGHAFTGKRKGITLTSVGEGIRIYTTNNIHLTPKPSHKYMRDGSKKEHKVSVIM